MTTKCFLEYRQQMIISHKDRIQSRTPNASLRTNCRRHLLLVLPAQKESPNQAHPSTPQPQTTQKHSDTAAATTQRTASALPPRTANDYHGRHCNQKSRKRKSDECLIVDFAIGFLDRMIYFSSRTILVFEHERRNGRSGPIWLTLLFAHFHHFDDSHSHTFHIIRTVSTSTGSESDTVRSESSVQNFSRGAL